MLLLTLSIVLLLTDSNNSYLFIYSSYFHICLYHSFLRFVFFFSPSLSHFLLHKTHSTIYLVWFEFITTSIRFPNNILYKKFSLQTANNVSKQKKVKRKNYNILKNMFCLYFVSTSFVSPFLELSATI